MSWGAAFGHGFLQILGLGSQVDPLGDLKSELSSKTSEFYNNNMQNALAFAVSTDRTLKDLLADIQVSSDKSYRQLSELSSDVNMQFENIDMTVQFLSIFVFLIIFYIIIT